MKDKPPPTEISSVLPMELQIGDRFTDSTGEWELVTRPVAMHGAKSLRAKVRRPGQPGTERDVSWAAHEKVKIRRHG